MKKLSIFLMMGGMVLTVAPAFADTCSNQTISNRTLHQLEVTPGKCFLTNVIVNGGITVDGGAHLQLVTSTVYGGINVQPNGELDIQATTPISRGGVNLYRAHPGLMAASLRTMLWTWT